MLGVLLNKIVSHLLLVLLLWVVIVVGLVVIASIVAVAVIAAAATFKMLILTKDWNSTHLFSVYRKYIHIVHINTSARALVDLILSSNICNSRHHPKSLQRIAFICNLVKALPVFLIEAEVLLCICIKRRMDCSTQLMCIKSFCTLLLHVVFVPLITVVWNSG